MAHQNNYLSEFEREFELEDFSSAAENESDDEFEDDFEFEDENDFEQPADEYEFGDEPDGEFESDDEQEFQSEYELDDEQSDWDSENYLQEHSSPETEFEDRLFQILSGNYETHFEMEQALDGVLHEMEIEYFWKPAKNFWRKYKHKILPLAKNLLPGGTLASLAKLAGGDLRSLLKSELLKKGLSMAANVYLPGVGGAIAGKLLNNETIDPNTARRNAGQIVAVAKNAYNNMAQMMPGLRRGDLSGQIQRFSRQALSAAKTGGSVYRGKTRKVIPVKSGSIVVVRPGKVIIYS